MRNEVSATGDTRTVRDELRHFNQLLNLSDETVVRLLISESGAIYRVLNLKTLVFITVSCNKCIKMIHAAL